MLTKTCVRHCVAAFLRIAILSMLVNISLAAGDEQHQYVNGLAVNARVLPAVSLGQSLSDPSLNEVHGGLPAWGEQYHVIVTIFDKTSGIPVTDAEVSSWVINASLPGKRVSGPTKKLEPMRAASGTAYGNYFNMPGPTSYRIELDIRRPGMDKAARVTFEYKHAVVTARLCSQNHA